LPKKTLKSIQNLTEYVQKEFKTETISAIGVFDNVVNEYVMVEQPRDLKGASKFKIYILNSVSVMSSSKSVPLRSKEESQLRVELAAAYRLFEIFGWTDLIYNHITVSVPGEDSFLINPFGLLFSEITASSLVKVDIDGNILDPGCTEYGINKAGYVIHSAIHQGRKDIRCVMHCHSTAGVAVACMKQGLMKISQNSAIVGGVSYHNFEGLAVKLEERERLVTDLGTKHKVMICAIMDC